MPYAANVYTVPPGTEAATLTPVDSADFNAFVDDIAAAQNAARPVVAGGTGGTSVITGWDGLAKKGTDIATGASINLTTATGPSLSLTGGVTVTAVTLAEGAIRVVRAAAAFAITASANLLCNGSASVGLTVAAEDTLIFRGGAGGVVSVVKLGGGGTAASNTEQITGTSTAVFSTPDSVAALWEKGSDVASAGTVSLGEGGFFHITGTTTITDIDFATAKDGRTADVIFDGALTLTHNGTTLQLPGGANITTAAGDRARFVQDSSDNVICISYQPADAMPKGWAVIDVQILSGASSYAKTGLSAYRMLRLTYHLAVSSDGTSLNLRTSSNNGSSYDSTANDYYYSIDFSQGTASAGLSSSTATSVPLYNGNVGNASGEMAVGEILMTEFNQSVFGAFSGKINDVPSSGTPEVGEIFARRMQATARNAIQITPGAGTMTGYVLLEGIRG